MVFKRPNPWRIRVIIIISVFSLGLGGCTSKLVFQSIQSKSKCECKKNAYWYKDSCWKNFNYSEITRSTVDSIVNAELKSFELTPLQVNKVNIPVETFFMIPEDKIYLSILVFEYENSLHTLLSEVDENKLGKAKKQFPISMFEGDIFQNNMDSIPMASGICSFQVKDKENLSMTFRAELNSKQGNDINVTGQLSESLMGKGNSKIEIIDN